MTQVRGWLAAAAGLGTLALVGACSSGGGQTKAAAGGSTMTVEVRDVSGAGQVLVDDRGRTLYYSDQEKSAGKVLCSSSDCVAIWTPLTLVSGKHLAAPAGISGELATVRRPNGARQVTLKGLPLYTFSFDHAAGELNGEGTKDSFNGINFTWHAASANGVVVTPSNNSSTSNNGGYGY